MIDTLVHNINTIVTLEREKNNVSNLSFLLPYIESVANPTFKVYKTYKCSLVKITPTLKMREELLHFEKVGKVPAGNEAEFRKKVEEEFMLHILKFFKSKNFDIFINNGEVSKTTVQ